MFSVAHVHRWSSRWMGLFLWILGLHHNGETHFGWVSSIWIVSREKSLHMSYVRNVCWLIMKNVTITTSILGIIGDDMVLCMLDVVAWLLYGVIWCFMVLYGVLLSNIYIYIHIYILLGMITIHELKNPQPVPVPPFFEGPTWRLACSQLLTQSNRLTINNYGGLEHPHHIPNQ